MNVRTRLRDRSVSYFDAIFHSTTLTVQMIFAKLENFIV